MIKSNGNVGVGTTSPTHKLDVNGDLMTRASIYLGGTTNVYLRNTSNEIFFGTNGTDRMRIESGGRTFIGGGSAAASKLDVNGNVTIGASYAAVNVAPTNGLLVEGSVGIGTSSPLAG